ncbi:MAG: hypothetical protein JJLCMIEE_01366 [Acidimicrobiales bacterium]|nr:MAG: PQQ-dependent sugar dehydrogenase [Actinomycetota bacterium]MBV6508306.1 hypothetical protein [Acidimicrobiales bacterium]RIK07089.1 MAG: hypothetical protein DCC48_04665 [Acidobacteriota bacterium]
MRRSRRWSVLAVVAVVAVLAFDQRSVAGAAPTGAAFDQRSVAGAAPTGAAFDQRSVAGAAPAQAAPAAQNPDAQYGLGAGGLFLTTGYEVSGLYRPVTGDFDGDGNDDVFWYVPGSGSHILQFGTPTDYFESTTVASALLAYPVPGDFDGDGNDDVFMYGPGSLPDQLWWGRADRHFDVTGVSRDGVHLPRVGDFDGDGNDDILWHRWDIAVGEIWYGDGSRAFSPAPPFWVISLYLPVVGNFDAAAGDDIIWYGPGSLFDFISWSNGNGSFTNVVTAINGLYRPFAGDFDNAAAEDVFWYGPGGGADLVQHYLPNRSSTLRAASVVGGYEPVTGDFDGDGGDDVIWYGYGSSPDAAWHSLAGQAPPDPGLTITQLVTNLNIPWDLTFTDDGSMLFTQRGGVLAVRRPNGSVNQVSADMSDLFASGETGLMGIVVDPSFASNRRFYTCQGHTGPKVQVIAWTLSADYQSAQRVVDPLVDNLPSSGGRHGGCRLRFDCTGSLLVTTGDAAIGTNPQNLGSLGGKVLRVNPVSGQGVAGNPFAGSANANTRRILTYGHRNPQGIDVRPGSCQVWAVEHGSYRDDEINLLRPGRNYGWDPVPGYNEAVPMTDLSKFPTAVPAAWSSGSSTIATSGAMFLRGAQWEGWEGALAVATLKNSTLRIFRFNNGGGILEVDTPAGLNGTYGRLRSPVPGPDGCLYITTGNGGGSDSILRVCPS